MSQSLKIIFTTLWILSISVGVLTAYEEPTVEFEARQWDASFNSKVRLIKNLVGTSFDVDDTLNVEDEEIPEGIFTFSTGENSKMRVSYFTSKFEGVNTLTESFDFLGETYTVGLDVNSTVEITYARLGWLYYLNDAADALRVGTIVELKAIDFDLDLSVPLSATLNQSESAAGGLPTIGVMLEFRPTDGVLIFAEAAGLTDGGEYGHFFEAEAGVKYNYENFSISAGYRMLELKIENDEEFIEIGLSGPYAAVHVQF